MRMFVGIDFSMRLKDQIAGLQKKLKAHAVAGRWKYIDNFHLTLKFLSEVDNAQVGKINHKIMNICDNTDGFRLNISEAGLFPGKGNIRVLWLGLNGELSKLEKLQSGIDSGLEEIGFEAEKRVYKPHITIGQDIAFKMEFEGIKSIVDKHLFDEIIVDRVHLFKSEQVENKRVYTPISEYLLRET
ncbi:MAG: RNA 2',3'-cyclic phosphodiesterase [Clostridia bacterium]|nr:RNA 2',3'-cyclic phosphodiesterase [Clostridia bacterium]